MISKKDFCDAIKLIQDHRKKEDDLYAALKAIHEDCSGVFLFAKYEDLVIDLLAKDLCPDSDILYWWIFDAEFGTASYTSTTLIRDGKSYLLTTPEALYDFLTGNEDPIE